MTRSYQVAFYCIAIFTSTTLADVFNMPAGQTSLDTVHVGDAGNAADMRYNLDVRPEGYGSVNCEYRIGKYEVTAGQYTEFLNAVAKTDTYGLYNRSMWSDTTGCKIERAGSSGSYSYSVASDYANRPVNYVSWGDSARFANWLTNGQPTGEQGLDTTEDGSYYLNGAMSNEALMAVMRKVNARYVIPTEDEWYKAAYHKNDGVTSNYWDYPTSSNIKPSNSLGNPTDPGNNATYLEGCFTLGAYLRTEVGEHENSDSPYGTFDQGGNVWEWNETIINGFDGSYRGMRGGSFEQDEYYLRASIRYDDYNCPTIEESIIGFRIVEVPEPASLLLLSLGGLALIRRTDRYWDHDQG